MNDQITTLNEETYFSFTTATDCAVVFFKSRCPNCKVLLKVMEKVKVANPEMSMACISSEEDESVAKQLDVSRVPTVLIYKDGEIRNRKVGIMKPVDLEALYRNA